VESAAARLICNDKNLMNAYDAFRVVLQNSVERTPDGPIKGAMLREHFAWVKERNTRCGLDGKDNATLVELSSAKTCLLGALNERTDYLRSQ
jgi:uncharacterized protein YecT (DUF1311 family)